MKRKLVKQGTATLMLSLPSKWIKQNNLSKGDEVEIEEENQNLIVKLEESSKKEMKAKVNVSDLSPLTNVFLINLYIKGFDELEITYDKPEIAREYQKRTINELIGFEIIKQTNNSLLIKDISDENQDVDELIKRIFFILESMADEFSEAVDKKQNMDPIIDIDTSVNKFANFCLRILNKRGYKEHQKTHHYYGIVKQLEEIGDVYKSIAREIKGGAKIDKHQLEILNDCRKMLELFKELLFGFSRDKAIQCAKKYEQIKSKLKNKNKIDFHLNQLNHSIIQMNHYILVMGLP